MTCTCYYMIIYTLYSLHKGFVLISYILASWCEKKILKGRPLDFCGEGSVKVKTVL